MQRVEEINSRFIPTLAVIFAGLISVQQTGNQGWEAKQGHCKKERLQAALGHNQVQSLNIPPWFEFFRLGLIVYVLVSYFRSSVSTVFLYFFLSGKEEEQHGAAS
jgi:hypothetical protein